MKASTYCSRAIFIGITIFFMLFSLRTYAQDSNGNTYKQSAEEKRLIVYIYKHATNVIELKNGDKIIGKITGEIPNAVFIKRIDGDIDEKIERSMVKATRKPTVEELQDLKILFKSFEIKNETILEKKVAEEKERKKALEERYQEQVRSAKKARRELDSRKSTKDEIEEAKKKGYICSGMDQADVIDVLGRPDRKEESWKGRAKRETWYYDKDVVNFYDGIVR